MDRRGRRSLRFLEKFEHLRAIFLFYKHTNKSKFETSQRLTIGVRRNEFRLSNIDVCVPRLLGSGYAKTNFVYQASTSARGGYPANQNLKYIKPRRQASTLTLLFPKIDRVSDTHLADVFVDVIIAHSVKYLF